jgi:hypothetical protein
MIERKLQFMHLKITSEDKMAIGYLFLFNIF